jgi:hypothetical protein
MNKYDIIFTTWDDVESEGLSKIIPSFETKATFSVGDTIMDNNCNEFTIFKVIHFVVSDESSTTGRQKTEIHCVADSLTQKEVEKFDDWQ